MEWTPEGHFKSSLAKRHYNYISTYIAFITHYLHWPHKSGEMMSELIHSEDELEDLFLH